MSCHFRCLLATVLTAVVGACAAAEQSVQVALKSTITQVQPMTGIVLWASNDRAKTHADAISLEYRYCGYNEVVGPTGEYDYRKLDGILDEIAKRNHQAILRFHFCYVGRETTVPRFIRDRSDYDETIGISEGQRTRFCDWSNKALRDFTLQFYTKFAERYDDDPRIAFLQTGFGLWAEYHIYDGPRVIGKTFPSKSFQAEFLRHLDQQFSQLPWSISIDAADGYYTPLRQDVKLRTLGFGLFDDSFLCKPHPRENARNWRTLGNGRWKRQPGGGEFSYYTKRDQRLALDSKGPNGVAFEKAAKQFHISYMIGNDQPRFQTSDRIKAASMATGYRFRVVDAVLNANTLQLRVTNVGVAPIYRDAFFSVGEKRSATSLRRLLPGDVLECSIEGVRNADVGQLTIHCDALLPGQKIQFEAEL